MSDKKAVKLEREQYTIEVNYSEEAIAKKLMRFIPKDGQPFEISAEEMSSILIGQVNSNTVEATFVESDKVHVVEVLRQIRVRADRDIKKGEEIRLDYTHPYPVEFAIIEQGLKLAKINMSAPAFTLDAEFLKSVKEKITPQQENFVDKIYKFFKNLRPNRAEKRAVKKTAASP